MSEAASASRPSGTVLIVAAPSGAGKSSLVSALLERDRSMRLSVSTTTRAPRAGEEDGREYHFVSVEQFKQRLAAGEFLEHAEVFGNFYGTSRRLIEDTLAAGHDVLLEIDWQGAQQVRRHFADAVGIFILPPSYQALKSRLVGRGQDSSEVIERRMHAAKGEIEHAREFEYVIINQDFPVALEQLTAIVAATRLRFRTQAARYAEIFAKLGV